MNVLLPIILLVTWFAVVLVPAGKLAIEDELNGTPPDQRRGTSIFPVFPFAPLLFWALAFGIDRMFPSWGSWIILILHAALLVLSVAFITRDILHLRRISNTKS